MKARCITVLMAVSCLAAAPALAQTANSSPTSGGGGGGNASRTAPSGGTAKPDAGMPQSGPETPVEKKAEEQSKKDIGICKGC